MKFDYILFFTGIFIGILFMIIKNKFFVRTSYFDASVFMGKNTDEATTLYQKMIDDSSADLKAKSEKLIAEGNATEAKKLAIDVQKYQQDLSLAFNTYMIDKVPENEPSIEAPSPAPAPATSPAQEPSPSPQTSTYEIEPYHG
jgi:hypothetical protein